MCVRYFLNSLMVPERNKTVSTIMYLAEPYVIKQTQIIIINIIIKIIIVYSTVKIVQKYNVVYKSYGKESRMILCPDPLYLSGTFNVHFRGGITELRLFSCLEPT